MNLRPWAAAAVLSLCASSSFAIDSVVTLTGGSGFFGATRAGAFNDNFIFSFGSASTASSAVSSINLGGLQDVSFTSVNLTTGAGFTTVVATFNNVMSGAIELRTLTTSPTLTAGVQYAISVIGTASGGNGSYSGTVNVSPIPEPETYALMLAGLVAGGFLSRRRSNSR